MKRSPLKRTPFKKTKREPRGQSKAIREAYKAENPQCEIEKFLKIELHGEFSVERYYKFEINHIFTNPKRDLTPLMITLRGTRHDWFHRHIQEGRILCMVAKIRKGEADLAVWQKAFGARNLWGWFMQVPIMPEFETYRAELLAYLRSL